MPGKKLDDLILGIRPEKSLALARRMQVKKRIGAFHDIVRPDQSGTCFLVCLNTAQKPGIAVANINKVTIFYNCFVIVLIKLCKVNCINKANQVSAAICLKKKWLEVQENSIVPLENFMNYYRLQSTVTGEIIYICA